VGVSDPRAWVANVERLYQAHDAAGVEALYEPTARTRMGSMYLTPREVHEHPYEWFESLDNYQLTRTFRAASGDVIVSETTAEYVVKAEGKRYREFGIDVYWVNDHGRIYHKHTSEIVEPYGQSEVTDHFEGCQP
jgi:nuclear transport factor 2 (NTF2) superfamily protein